MKVLLVGDLRSAHNWGANSTSDMLLELINRYVDYTDIDYIDYKSFMQETPDGGWPDPATFDLTKIRIKKKIKKILGIKPKKLLKPVSSFHEKNIIPDEYDSYQEFAEGVLKGKYFQYERQKIEKADHIIINSEGSIVHSQEKSPYRRTARFVLFMAYLAKEVFKKKVSIINHTVDPNSENIARIIKNIYPKVDKIYVREEFSESYLKSLGIAPEKISVIPDALFLYNNTLNKSKNIMTTKKYICLGDSSTSPYVTWDIIKTYQEIIQRLKDAGYEVCIIDGNSTISPYLEELADINSLKYYNYYNCSYKKLYNIYQGAEMYISGRYHPSILAAQAGCPLLLWSADSYKTKGLSKLLGYKNFFMDINTLDSNIDELMKLVSEISNQQQELSNSLFSQCSILEKRLIKGFENLNEF